MRIHRNLHNARRGGPQWVHTARGKVQAYLDSVCLVNVTTRIQPAGQRKCQESGVRSVCAFFDGDRPAEAYLGCGEWHRVSYDPRKDEAFLFAVGGFTQSWNTAEAVRLDTDGSCYVLNPTWES